MSERVVINQLATGVPGLDEVLGGGIPDLSFNLIAGGPGGGKTTLAHQIMFGMASAERPALFITILGEPPVKMLRYQQQYSFFDHSKVSSCVRFLYLGRELVEDGLEKVLQRIVAEVERTSPKLVFVDSFRSVARKAMEPGQMELQHFLQRLSLHLTGWEATTFLVGEYEEVTSECSPIFTVADGVIFMSQATNGNSMVRTVQIVKMRGQGPVPGLHTMKISQAGVRVYPRLRSKDRPAVAGATPRPRRKTGVAGLDEMLCGGIPEGYSVIIVGPSGTGKTIMATQFIREGIENGESGVIAVFERRPEEYLATAQRSDELARLVETGKLKILHLRPLDLSVDETMEEIAAAVQEIGATRVAIDSLSGFELALAPAFRADFRESLYRMVGGLVELGVTIVMTAEVVESFTELVLSPHGISFLTDGLILQRYAEVGGQLRKVMCVVKMRSCEHSSEFRFYEIGPSGLIVDDGAEKYEGILIGSPRRVEAHDPTNR